MKYTVRARYVVPLRIIAEGTSDGCSNKYRCKSNRANGPTSAGLSALSAGAAHYPVRRILHSYSDHSAIWQQFHQPRDWHGACQVDRAGQLQSDGGRPPLLELCARYLLVHGSDSYYRRWGRVDRVTTDEPEVPGAFPRPNDHDVALGLPGYSHRSRIFLDSESFVRCDQRLCPLFSALARTDSQVATGYSFGDAAGRGDCILESLSVLWPGDAGRHARHPGGTVRSRYRWRGEAAAILPLRHPARTYPHVY